MTVIMSSAPSGGDVDKACTGAFPYNIVSSPKGDRQKRLLSRDQAADYLGVSSGTLAVWASSGRYALPFVKIGRLAKYDINDLDQFIKRQTRTQTA